MKYLATALLVALSLSPACETPEADKPAPSPQSEKTRSLTEARVDELVDAAQTHRDRDFDPVPAVVAVGSADKLPERPTAPAPVRGERERLLQVLFGLEDTSQALPHPAVPLADIARYVAKTGRVVFVDPHPDRAELEAAVFLALVAALDAQQFEADPEPASWDQELAAQAARHTTQSFALASYLLKDGHPGTEPAVLAKRPELVSRLPILDSYIEPQVTDGTTLEALQHRQRAFVLREGWTLAAALYRSSGWSGIELAHLMTPASTGDVVRPDRWMAGAPTGIWTWPEAWSSKKEGATYTGTIGPVLCAMWLSDVVEPRLARSVYAGWMADQYHHTPGDDQTGELFGWISLWNSPDAAGQIARAFELRLRERFAQADNPRDHFAVVHKGLKVAVVTSEGADPKLPDRAGALAEVQVKLEPREALPVEFMPSRHDQLTEQMAAAKLEDRTFTDPAANLVVDLSDLPDDWKLQQADSGPVRWFAKHPQGSLLQMTLELHDPLGPEFGSQAYRTRLVEAFESTLQSATVDDVAATELALGEAVVVRMRGQIGGQKRTLQLWQFRRGDVLVSYSIQAPPQLFEAHRKLARTLIGQMHPADPNKSPASPQKETEGTIKYKVEESE